ncbi:hypothetical protein N1851_010604 [Merluccius polli]|uniref:Uncharacterized protein n=1 Tax=Merluccius polli TaxID=89951 RepID=A0AA47MZQ8_MERPO|nr:hypothetical protein N1851_010604 [Merluccius polli]
MNCGWDDEIPPALASKCSEWQKDLHVISDFRIKICYKPVDYDVTDTQLHHFCDASESGYGSVSYIRLISRGRPPHITCWLNGPDFLAKCEADWPKLSTEPLVLSDSDSEVKKTVVAFATTAHEDPLTQFIEYFSVMGQIHQIYSVAFEVQRDPKTLDPIEKSRYLKQCIS